MYGQACETTEPQAIRQQFPFYSEIQSIFTARMQRNLWSEPTEGSTSSKRKHHQFSSDEEDEDKVDEEQNQEINEALLSFIETDKKEAEAGTTSTCTDPRKRVKKGKGIITGSTKAETAVSTILKEVLEDFMRQTVKMDKEWKDAWEMKAREREKRENEWRRRMADLEEERAAAERRWMEREDERRLREEARAQKRDALIDALLNKLNRDHNDDHYQGF